MKGDTKLQALADEIIAMTPAGKLRVAAGLLEQGMDGMARMIIRLVSDELLLLKRRGDADGLPPPRDPRHREETI